MVPRLFCLPIIAESLRAILPSKHVRVVMANLPIPSEFDARVTYVRELVAFVNSDNRYKLCVVNRRNSRYAVFILTPYGTVKTEQIAYAFGLPYEEKYDSICAQNIDEISDVFESLGFNSTVIAESFIDDNI